MILAVDAGNSHIVLGCINEKNEIVTTDRLETDVHKTESEYAVLLKGILEFNEIDPKCFEGAILSSVVPPLNAAIISAIKKVTGCDTNNKGTNDTLWVNTIVIPETGIFQSNKSVL